MTYSYAGNELELFQHARHWKNYYASRIRPFIVGDVLEVGAGLGATSGFLCDGSQRSWTSLEPDRRLFDQLEANFEREPLTVPFVPVLGTVAELPVEATFDTILYIDVLEHIEDDRAELSAGAAHLRSAGHLIVLAPAHQSLYSPFDRAIGHYRRYNKGTLLGAAPPSLRLVRAFYLDAAGLTASFANRWILKADMPTPRDIAFWDGVLVPISQTVDRVFAYTAGKTVIAIWTRA
jgi:SAM-dependent methyltransferase